VRAASFSVPGPKIDTDVVFEAARTVQSRSEAIETLGVEIVTTWHGMSTGYETPDADTLLAVMDPVVSLTAALAPGAAQVARALRLFAADVEVLNDRIDRVRVSADQFVTDIQGVDDWEDNPALAEQNADLLYRVQALVTAQTEAEQECARAIRSATASVPTAPSGSSPGASGALGEYWPLGQAMRGIGDSAATMSEPLSADLLSVVLNPVFFSGMTPEEVTIWWNSLSPADQSTMVTLFPWRIGNRDGIPAGVRDLANRSQLARERTKLEAKKDALLEQVKAKRDFREVERHQGHRGDARAEYRRGPSIPTPCGLLQGKGESCSCRRRH
jgi:hypothetical protein